MYGAAKHHWNHLLLCPSSPWYVTCNCNSFKTWVWWPLNGVCEDFILLIGQAGAAKEKCSLTFEGTYSHVAGSLQYFLLL